VEIAGEYWRKKEERKRGELRRFSAIRPLRGNIFYTLKSEAKSTIYPLSRGAAAKQPGYVFNKICPKGATSPLYHSPLTNLEGDRQSKCHDGHLSGIYSEGVQGILFNEKGSTKKGIYRILLFKRFKICKRLL